MNMKKIHLQDLSAQEQIREWENFLSHTDDCDDDYDWEEDFWDEDDRYDPRFYDDDRFDDTY